MDGSVLDVFTATWRRKPDRGGTELFGQPSVVWPGPAQAPDMGTELQRPVGLRGQWEGSVR